MLKNISRNINNFRMITMDDTIDNSISQNPLTHSPLPNLLTKNTIQEIA